MITRASLASVVGVTLFCVVTLAAPITEIENSRLVTVISDLHMGVGRDLSSKWHVFEDFRWHTEFELFLEALNEEGGAANDLILNGDTFELWETITSDCRYNDPSLGCTELEALARLERVLTAHEPVLSALLSFADSGSNRVVIIPGDHDAALLFPAAARRVVQALGGSTARVEVRASGFWVSTDGQIFVEHGHQISTRSNRYSDWPLPFIERRGRRHIERSQGEKTVAALNADQESRFPIIDNLADSAAELWYGLSAAGVTDVSDVAPALLQHVLFRIPWTQFRVDLDVGDVQPPAWDLVSVRAQGATFLGDSLPDDHRFKSIALTALRDGRLASLMSGLSDTDLTTICDYRAAVRRSRRRFERILTQFDPQGPVVTECPRIPSTTGGAFDYFWRSRDLMFLRHLELAQRRIAAPVSGAAAEPIAVFVHGHTHLVDWRQRVLEVTSQGETVIVDGFSPLRGALSPVVVNGGAWQRTVTPVQIETLKKAHSLTDTELFETLRPEHLAPCYSFVQIEPYYDTPGLPVIRYWRRGSGGWELGASCELEPSLERGE